MKKLNIDKERVILVPGNHDVNWNLQKMIWVVDLIINLLFKVTFMEPRSLKRDIPKIGHLKIWGSTDPSDLLAIYSDPKLNLTIVGFNSCVYESDQHHYGFIGGCNLELSKRNLINPLKREVLE